HQHFLGGHAQESCCLLCGGAGVGEAFLAGGHIGPAGVEHHGTGLAAAGHLAAPLHRCAHHTVGGEHTGGHVLRAVVDHEGQIGAAGGSQPGGDTGSSEALRGGDGHRATASEGRPRVSGHPHARFIDCTAAPAVPLTRLSMAQTLTTRPALSSTATCTWAVFAPTVPAVLGHCPSARTCTKGSSA